MPGAPLALGLGVMLEWHAQGAGRGDIRAGEVTARLSQEHFAGAALHAALGQVEALVVPAGGAGAATLHAGAPVESVQTLKFRNRAEQP